MAYRPLDSKREEFRKYLERTGVMDALTKALVLLYEEESKPDNALDYIRKNLCDSSVEATEFEELKTKLEESAAREKKLVEEIAQLKGGKVDEGEPAKADKPERVEEKTEEAADKPGEEKPAEGAEANGAPPEEAAAPEAAPEAPATENNNQEPAAE